MNSAMLHRGPDDAGYYSHQHVNLAMRRLSIIDLAGGHQPIHDDTKTVWVVLNGEIYNFRELREELRAKGYQFYTKTDTEVVVYLYREYGAEFPRYLDGMFAVAVYDQRKDRLILARDRAGKKPLYYLASPDHFVFGSELKVLMRHPAVPKEIDQIALQQYLLFSCILTPRSIFTHVKKVPEGHYLVVERGVAEEPRQYWRYVFPEQPARAPEKEWIERVDSVLTRAVAKRLVADVPLGVFLSGGVDSSLIAAIMSRIMPPEDVKTFSIKVDDPAYDESKWSRWAADIIGSTHTEFNLSVDEMADVLDTVLGYLDEPMADSSILPTYVVSHLTRQHVTVALAGDAGDEVFGGYPKYFAQRWAARLEKLPGWLRKWGMQKPLSLLPSPDGSVLLGQNKVNAFFKSLDCHYALRNQFWVGAFQPEQIEELTGRSLDPSALEPVLSCAAAYIGPDDITTKTMYLDFKLIMQDDFNVKVDRASMMTSLEVREPFMDTALIELAASMPSRLKVKGMQTKYLLKKVTERYYPKEFIYRKKWGFGIPVKRWIRGKLRQRFEETLSPECIDAVGLVNSTMVQRMLAEHIAGKANHSHPLWNLFVLHTWYKNWMR